MNIDCTNVYDLNNYVIFANSVLWLFVQVAGIYFLIKRARK